jgi:cellulose synthase/poly-beta-1,6-N-acetylglucosamine synthase-like glycosyltransferase
MSRRTEPRSRLVVAGPVYGRSEKINNLFCAISVVSGDCEVLVFADSDARVPRRWLRALISRLDEPGIGATTGYRWYTNGSGGFWPALLAAWNGSVATTLGDHGRNFAWGGSTAIKRELFERIGVAGLWQNAVSDDYALTRAVQQAGLRVAYVPSCLVPTRHDATFSELLEFTTRQVIITRVYRPNVWRIGLASHLLFSLVFFGGLAVAANAAANAAAPSGGVIGDMVSFLPIAIIYVLGSAKGSLRLTTAAAALPERRDEVWSQWWMFVLLWPLVSLLFVYNFLRSATTRRITWRGTSYELRSPTETIVISNKASPSH